MKRRPSMKVMVTLYLVTVGVVPLLIVGYFAARFLTNDLTSRISRQNTALAKSVAGEAGRLLSEPEALLRHVCDAVAGPSPAVQADIDTYLQQAMDRYAFFLAIWVLDGNRRVCHLAPHDKHRIGHDLSGQPYIQEAALPGGPFWTSTTTPTDTGETALVRVIPFEGGILVGYVHPAILGTITKGLEQAPGMRAVVIDRRGAMIAQPDQTHGQRFEESKSLPAIRQALKDGRKSGRIQAAEVETFYGVVGIPGTDWVAAVLQPVDEALAPVSGIRSIFAAGAWAVIVLTLLISLALRRSAFTPLSRLLTSIRNMIQGAYDIPARKPGFAEIDELFEDFALMAGTIKSREDALAEREKLFRAMAENSPRSYVSIIEKDMTVGFTSGQEFVRQGLDPESYVGMSLDQVFGEHADIVRENYTRTFKGQEARFELFIYDQHQLYRTVPLVDEDGGIERILVVVENITERKNNERQLKSRENFLNRLFEQSPFPAWISDAGGTMLRANPALKNLLNLTDEQVVGKYNVFEDPLVEKQGLMPLIRMVFEEGRTVNFTCDWKGEDIPALDLKGSNAVSIEATMFPIHDPDGRLTNVVLNWIDISDRKLAEEEKRKMERQLLHTQKMESIGTLAGGIAHDFNNILGTIIGYIQLGLMDADDPVEVRHNLEQARIASLRGKNLVRQILSFSRRSPTEFKPIAMDTIVREALDFLRSSLPTSIEINTDIQGKTRPILGDPTQIHQVLINLCTNAAQAVGSSKGRIDITLREIAFDAEPEPFLKKGPYLLLTVADNGPGIPEEYITQVFDPFFSTKSPHEGTGMGLAVVHGIVKNHGGLVKVHSEPGQGSAFHVYLPAVSAPVVVETAPEVPLPGGSERILYVDDEESLVKVAGGMLKKLGYRVEGTTNSIRALDEIKQNGYKYDLVITDQTMPRMTGVELSQVVMSLYPDLPIIICTGFSASMDEKKAREMGMAGFLMKPLAVEDLALTVRSVLDAVGPKRSSSPEDQGQ